MGGIDMPTKKELLACRHADLPAIAAEIGADRIFYQDLSDLQSAIFEEAACRGSKLSSLDCSCFDGKYVTQHVGEQYLFDLASSRDENRGEANPQHLLDKLAPAFA